MQMNKRHMYVVLASACALLMSACSASMSVSQSTGQKGVTVTGTVSTNLDVPDVIGNAVKAQTSSVDLSTLDINTTGTSFALDSSGQVVITVYNSSGGVLGAQSFAWVRSGADIVLQDPASANAWINQFTTATSAGYTLEAGTVPETGGTVATALSYSGSQLSSASATFAAGCTPKINHPGICAPN